MLITSRDTARVGAAEGNHRIEHVPRLPRRGGGRGSGVSGTVVEKPIGSYNYVKTLRKGGEKCNVEVFTMRVAKVKDEWPEMADRSRKDEFSASRQAGKRKRPQTPSAHCRKEVAMRLATLLTPPRIEAKWNPIMEISMDRRPSRLSAGDLRGSTSETGPVDNDKARSRGCWALRDKSPNRSNRALEQGSDTRRERSGKRRRDLSPMADPPYRWLGSGEWPAVNPPIDRLREIMAKLRDPDGGCPWDREQTLATIASHTIEEAYEVVDAIETGDMDHLRDELGDLLLQVVFHAQMAKEAGLFDFDSIATAICDKMVKRHPHVFGDEIIETVDAQTNAWEEQKAGERAVKGGDSIMYPFWPM